MGMPAQQRSSGNGLSLATTSTLIVDGDNYAIDILRSILRGFGLVSPTIVQAGAAAKERVNRKKFDLVITEAALPDMTGIELVKWIRRHEDADVRSAAVVLVTGHTLASNIEAVRDAGAHFVVKKPISAPILFDRLVWAARSERPFIETDTYAGPDRRFRFLGPPNGIGRRHTDVPPEIGEASEPNLSQSDIDSFLKPVKIKIE